MRDKPSACSPLLRGDGPETGVPRAGGRAVTVLAVPSYGAMALKPEKHGTPAAAAKPTCSPLLRGDGPETSCRLPGQRWGVRPCSPPLRGDGPETPALHPCKRNSPALQSPPTGRWP